jgi:two-component system CheB/CheR fusion protein
MRFNRAAAGREMRMIELKVEVNELCRRLGEDPRYGFPADAKSDPALKESGQ